MSQEAATARESLDLDGITDLPEDAILEVEFSPDADTTTFPRFGSTHGGITVVEFLPPVFGSNGGSTILAPQDYDHTDRLSALALDRLNVVLEATPARIRTGVAEDIFFAAGKGLGGDDRPLEDPDERVIRGLFMEGLVAAQGELGDSILLEERPVVEGSSFVEDLRSALDSFDRVLLRFPYPRVISAFIGAAIAFVLAGAVMMKKEFPAPAPASQPQIVRRDPPQPSAPRYTTEPIAEAKK